MSEDPTEFQRAQDYFPYIGHDLSRGKFAQTAIWQNVIGTLFAPGNVTDRGESVTVQSRVRGSFLRKGLLFRRVEVEGLGPHREIARDPNAVEALVPRHRSLYDYSIGMPVHHELVNRETMVLAGDNLFVSKFDDELRARRGEVMRLLRAVEVAKDRDSRMGAMTKQAREQLIRSALESTPEGQVVLEALKALAKVVKS